MRGGGAEGEVREAQGLSWEDGEQTDESSSGGPEWGWCKRWCWHPGARPRAGQGAVGRSWEESLSPVTLALAQLARGQVLGAGLTPHRQIQDTLLWTLL